MANPEHVAILKQGVDVWNKWRRESPQVIPNLEGIRFYGAELVSINLENAKLWKADFAACNLQYANFKNANCPDTNISGAVISNVNFSNANLGESYLSGSEVNQTNFEEADLYNANLRDTNLSAANFKRANLDGTNFIQASLNGTDFHFSSLGNTIFGLTNLSTCKGLDTITAESPCTIDFYTLQNSPNLPKSFLRKIGLPENFIDYLPEFYDEKPLRLFPVFLSHSKADKIFVDKLYDALINKRGQVYYDDKEIKPGDHIRKAIDRGISLYDKMVLVCSEASLTSWWVKREVERILRKEEEISKAQGKEIHLLIPIKIDDYLDTWDSELKNDILRYHVGDFCQWQDQEQFEKALKNLIEALNVDRSVTPPMSYL